MATKSKKTILNLEKQYWEAMKRRDGDAAARLTSDPCVVVGPQGIMEVDQKSIAGMVKDSSFELQEYELDEKSANVQMIGRNVAISTYPVHERMLRDGKPESMDAYNTSVWVRKDGGWACAAHAETLAESGAQR